MTVHEYTAIFPFGGIGGGALGFQAAEAACSPGSEQHPVILAPDGSWHRPLTTLELAALQGFPAQVGGRWLELSGTSQSAWRERIGNAVPPPTAQAVATRMLTTMLQSEVGAWSLSSDGAVWVERATEVASV